MTKKSAVLLHFAAKAIKHLESAVSYQIGPVELMLLAVCSRQPAGLQQHYVVA